MPHQAGALLVSLQDRSCSSIPTEGHRGFGVLYGTDLAVVVLGPGASWSSAFDLEVLVTPADPEDDTIVERHRLLHIEVVSLRTAPESRVAAIRLATTSRYATLPPVRSPCPRLCMSTSSAPVCAAARSSDSLRPQDTSLM